MTFFSCQMSEEPAAWINLDSAEWVSETQKRNIQWQGPYHSGMSCARAPNFNELGLFEEAHSIN